VYVTSMRREGTVLDRIDLRRLSVHVGGVPITLAASVLWPVEAMEDDDHEYDDDYMDMDDEDDSHSDNPGNPY